MQEQLLNELREEYNNLMEEARELAISKILKKLSYINYIHSNNIMIYMGTYIEGTPPKLTFDNAPKANYKKYINLETCESQFVPLGKCHEFDKEYLTIYIPVSEYTEQNYQDNFNNVQRWFLKELLNYPQQEVISKLQKLYHHKYNNLYNATHNYPEKILSTTAPFIENKFSAKDFIATHPKDGFIEKFCLSSEEKKQANLERYNQEHLSRILSIYKFPFPKMRIYRYVYDKSKYECIDFNDKLTLTNYIKTNNLLMKNIEVLEYLGNFADRTDVIKVTNNDGEYNLYSAIDNNSYVKYSICNSLSQGRDIWDFKYGNLKKLYLPFINKGIILTNNVFTNPNNHQVKTKKNIKK